MNEGIAIAYVRDYCGVGSDGMLRIAVFATHTAEMIDRLIAALDRVLGHLGTGHDDVSD
jgi:hypothetical protein